MSRSISRRKTNFPGVACSVLLYEHPTAYVIEARIYLNGETASNLILARSLVFGMITTAW